MHKMMSGLKHTAWYAAVGSTQPDQINQQLTRVRSSRCLSRVVLLNQAKALQARAHLGGLGLDGTNDLTSG